VWIQRGEDINRGNRLGRMVQSILVGGKRICHITMVYLLVLRVTRLRGSGSRASFKVLASTSEKQVHTKVSGPTTSPTVMAYKPGRMAAGTKAPTTRAKSTVKASIHGPTTQHTLVSGLMGKSQDSVLTDTLMGEFTRAVSETTRCTARALIHGQMGGSTLDIIKRIENGGKGVMSGQMGDILRVNGLKAREMGTGR
jgi:hypothetical protein